MSVCLSDRQGRAGRQLQTGHGKAGRGGVGRPGQGRRGRAGQAKRPGKFQDVVFRTWFLRLGISTLGPGKFQDMVFRTWFSGLGISTLGLGKFQDMVFKTWFSRLGISTLGPGFSHSRFPRPKLENFQDVIFRMWDLNFGTWISHRGLHRGLHSGLRPWAPTSNYRRQGPSKNSLQQKTTLFIKRCIFEFFCKPFYLQFAPYVYGSVIVHFGPL